MKVTKAVILFGIGGIPKDLVVGRKAAVAKKSGRSRFDVELISFDFAADGSGEEAHASSNAYSTNGPPSVEKLMRGE